MGEKRTYTCEGGNIARNGPEGRGPSLTPRKEIHGGASYTDLDPVVDELNRLDARVVELEEHQKRWQKPTFTLSIGEDQYRGELLDIGHADVIFLVGCDDLAARIATLEAELAREREACRVLGEEVKGWRCGGLKYMDGAPGYGPDSIGVSKLKYYDACRNVKANPLARAAVEGK